MEYKSIFFSDLSVNVHVASFMKNGAGEYYLSANFEEVPALNAELQQEILEEAIERASNEYFNDLLLVWKRYFVSDSFNQRHFLTDTWSIVQQPPLDRSKISVIAYFVSGKNSDINTLSDNSVMLVRPNYNHLFSGQMYSREGNTFEQTTAIFESYMQSLLQHGMSLQDNTVRTWIYVHDVDNRYADMVEARNRIFDKVGLTTHSIASTGIEGRYVYPDVFVLMDAYSTSVSTDQITFLKAETHLNPTCEYGVSFERGTAVDYADRRHIFISGTASIDNNGEIVAINDIEKQIARTIENIEALLTNGNAKIDDVAHFTIYLRDSGDYSIVKDYFDSRYPDTPSVIVLAPVCRPGWLIEIECIAITDQLSPHPTWHKF
ncbi:MAG: hypothetical protein LBQ31_10010 [Bacteroidales bacterium]|jgi:enamine deaminase RidA (YjgF/YER057c/UK114 family)|nr:hypothetical protein [Bacteroidales bacterium]